MLFGPSSRGWSGRFTPQRVLDPISLGDDFGNLGLAANGTRDRFLGGLIIVLLDFLSSAASQ